ncbi:MULTISPECIES: hypothetical protein [unclassified Endozoicomonas]|uniref:hypothetical protein n=1 Tax=unclassified Endozoicomonas TaxID=2644528 RepID=UPI003BB4B8C6
MNASDSTFPPVITQPQTTAQIAPDNNCKCPDGVVSNRVVPVGGCSLLGAVGGTLFGAVIACCNPVGAYFSSASAAVGASVVCCLATGTVAGAAVGTYVACKSPSRTGLKERAITGSTMTNTLTAEQQQCQGLPSALTSLAAGNSSGSTGPVRSQPTAAGCPRIGAAVRYQPNAGVILPYLLT